MTSTENITTVRCFWEDFNAPNLAVWDAVCTVDFMNHDSGLPTPDTALPSTKQAFTD
jgi:hypothetical protein